MGLVVGQFVKHIVHDKNSRTVSSVDHYMKMVQMLALVLINPIINMGAFWIVPLSDIKIIVLPILCVFALTLGGALGIFYSKVVFKHEPKQTGSMFVSGSFTNIGNFGGLICYAFFGEISYGFVSMYVLLELISYYLIGYPIAKSFSDTDGKKRNLRHYLSLLKDPVILSNVISIIIGISLNFSDIVRPAGYKVTNEFLIPFSSLLLVITVGYRMKIRSISKYKMECIAIASAKFIIIPICITFAAYLLGLGEIENGLPLKVVLVLSSMPPAFNSLIPPQLYNLDKDLANSSWIFSTGCLVFVIPALYFIQGFI